jgi:hypothetical protein
MMETESRSIFQTYLDNKFYCRPKQSSDVCGLGGRKVTVVWRPAASENSGSAGAETPSHDLGLHWGLAGPLNCGESTYFRVCARMTDGQPK